MSYRHEKRNRLQSYRGNYLPIRTLLADTPAALLQRLSRRSPATPWMAPAAVRRLQSVLQPQMRLLELGSGSSTRWYAERVKHVVSIETDPAWAENVRGQLLRSPNVDLRVSTVSEALSTESKSYDVAIVDHTEQGDVSRVEAIQQLQSRAHVIVLDDSDRPQYAPAFELLESWHIERYQGVRPKPLGATETTIFYREEAIRPSGATPPPA